MGAVTGQRTPRAVGILANAYGDPYSLRIAHAAAQEITRTGGHAIFFGGGFPRAPLFRQPNGTTALPAAIDTWVLLGEMLTEASGELVPVARSAKRAVTLGFQVENQPSVSVDDETGIFQAVAHLVRRHERRRIAFIAGPESSLDATHRLTAYRMAVESLGLKVDPALIVPGNYHPSSGREAVRQLKRLRNRFDAIVSANDLMAIGAIEALASLGVRVPEDVSVVGFDDLEDASFSTPTLTTIRQPLVELGTSAARLAWNASAEGEVERTVVPTPVVIRESCGCRSSDQPERRSVPPPVDAVRTQGLREEALREIVRRGFSSSRLHRELERLAESIVRAPDYAGLTRIMSEVVELLGLKRFLLCTYTAGERHVRVALESSGRDVAFLQSSQSFRVEDVLPTSYWSSTKPLTLIVEPLEFADEHFGYVVLEGDIRNGLAHLALRRHLGSTVARMVHGRELRRLYAAEKRRIETDR